MLPAFPTGYRRLRCDIGDGVKIWDFPIPVESSLLIFWQQPSVIPAKIKQVDDKRFLFALQFKKGVKSKTSLRWGLTDQRVLSEKGIAADFECAEQSPNLRTKGAEWLVWFTFTKSWMTYLRSTPLSLFVELPLTLTATERFFISLQSINTVRVRFIYYYQFHSPIMYPQKVKPKGPALVLFLIQFGDWVLMLLLISLCSVKLAWLFFRAWISRDGNLAALGRGDGDSEYDLWFVGLGFGFEFF